MQRSQTTALCTLFAAVTLVACQGKTSSPASNLPTVNAPAATAPASVIQPNGAVPAQFATLPDASVAEIKALSAAIDAAVAPALKKAPGLVVGVLKGGKRYVFAYGTADDAGTKPDGNTLFEIGAITQPLIGIVLSQMVAEGAVKLDDPVSQYLPADKKIPDKNGKQILLRHLATHTSELPRNVKGILGRSVEMLRAPEALSESAFWDKISKAKLSKEPGTTFEFSNLGVSLLAFALANKDGKTWDQMVARRVTSKLHMDNTFFTLDAAHLARKSLGHNLQGRAIEKSLPGSAGAMGPAGGLSSSTNDLLQLAAASMNPPQTPFAAPLYDSLRILFTADAGETGVAQNWFHKLQKNGRSLYVYAVGATEGFNSHLRFYPDRQLAISVLQNRYGLDVGLVPPRIENEVEAVAESVATALLKDP